MKSTQEFQDFYKTDLSKAANFLEEYRLQSKKIIKRRQLLSLAFVPLFLFSLVTKYGPIIFFAALPSLLFLSSVFKKHIATQKYLRFRYKKHVLQKAIGFYFEDFEYIARQKIAKPVLIESKLFPNHIDNIYGEDFMRFTLGKVKMMFCETSVYKNRDSLVFNGVFITSSFNKYFNSETFVIARKSSTFFQRIFKQWDGDIQEVKLEDSIFDKKFQTLANDQTEARYILTPVMMERIVSYGEKVGKDMSLSFVKNRMYCSIPIVKDLFEPSITKPIDLSFVSKSIEPVLLFTDIVTDLDLNLRIWSKR